MNVKKLTESGLFLFLQFLRTINAYNLFIRKRTKASKPAGVNLAVWAFFDVQLHAMEEREEIQWESELPSIRYLVFWKKENR